MAGLGIYAGHQHDMFGAMSEENIERIKRQNKRKISVIIGNPPYNANQKNENENNKNRTYRRIDERIKSTYVAASAAQKTKLYDMYARFFRWASDRLRDEGVIAFVTNRSFIDSRTFDGFRRKVADDFSEIWVVDLGGDVRANPRISGTKHNVFGIQTGVAISFMVKRKAHRGCTIRYARRPELETAEEKLAYLGNEQLAEMSFAAIEPDARNNWINTQKNDFNEFIPVADKQTKGSKTPRQERAIFRLFSLGIASNRDDWAYSRDPADLGSKASYFISKYESERKRWQKEDGKQDVGQFVSKEIKWTSELTESLKNGERLEFSPAHIEETFYRPFQRRFLYYDRAIVHRFYQQHNAFPPGAAAGNRSIAFLSISGNHGLVVLAVDRAFDLCLLKTGNGGTTGLSRWRFVDGERQDNITDWALEQFQRHYGKNVEITKDDIFHYVYGVLHDPVYRETYAVNLRREFPRIQFCPNFYRWVRWGETLMNLHINYETVEQWPLTRMDEPDQKARKAGLSPKVILQANREAGIIRLDSQTTLSGVPAEAWTYRLGNRSALDWILEQHKEKAPKDRTIREKFNNYRFADHKEKVIDLLMRVTRVSVETERIVEALRKESR